MAVTAPPSAPDRLPPQSVEAETAVLGGILMADAALDAVLIDVGLKAEHFYLPKHQLIYAAMLRLKNKAEPEPVDVVTVCADLEAGGELEPAGGEAYVHSLPTVVPGLGRERHYARIVKERAQLRRLLGALREAQDRVYEFHGPARELLDMTESAIYNVAHEDATSELLHLEEILHDELDRLERLSREGVHLTGTPSGFTDLDAVTGGFQPGNLIVLAARPSLGKSALAVNFAENAALGVNTAGKPGVPVAFFSLEMSRVELAHRFLASQARVSGDTLRKGQVKSDWRKVLLASEKLAKAPLYIDDSSDIGIHEVRAKVRRLHARHGLGLVIVDYLQLMRADDPNVSRVEQVGAISRGLKILARELDIPVVAISQLSRKVEDRHDKKPILSDLRESGNLEQDADVVMFIYRDEVYNREAEIDNKGEAEIIVAKHRNGPIGTVGVVFHERYPKFMNRAREHDLYPAPPATGGAMNGGGADRDGEASPPPDDDVDF